MASERLGVYRYVNQRQDRPLFAPLECRVRLIDCLDIRIPITITSKLTLIKNRLRLGIRTLPWTLKIQTDGHHGKSHARWRVPARTADQPAAQPSTRGWGARARRFSQGSAPFGDLARATHGRVRQALRGPVASACGQVRTSIICRPCNRPQTN